MLKRKPLTHFLPHPHTGALCAHIRTSRGILPTTIAEDCGVHLTNITRNFEACGMTNAQTFERYLRALQSPGITSRPLNPKQGQLLTKIHQSGKTVKNRQLSWSALNFEWIKTNRELRDWLIELENCGRPAYIIDNLWFIHALNGAVLRLFNTDTNAAYLQRWEGWHNLALKFITGSPTQNGYLNTNQHLPVSIKQFFEFEATYPLLFSRQMQHLLARLLELPPVGQYSFRDCWELVTAFNYPLELEPLSRHIKYQEQVISVLAQPQRPKNVKLTDGYTAEFCLLWWEPLGREAEEAFRDIWRFRDSRAVIFAADFDKNHDFHVNEWPEVKHEITSWLE